MKFKNKLLVSVCVLSVGFSNYAFAQDATKTTEEETVKTRTINVDSTKSEDVYTAKTGVNSGTSVIKGEAVQDNARSNGDANQILRLLPNVSFDKNRYDASRTGLQDIHPADISISGGRYY